LSQLTHDSAVDSNHVARAGRVALIGTGPLMLLSLILVVILALGAAPDKHHGSLLDWVRGAIWLAGLAWHGTVSATIRGNASTSESSSSGTYDASAYATFTPLLLTFFTLAFLAWAARTDERQRPSTGLGQLATRSIVTSVFLGVAWFLLSTASRASNGFGTSFSDSMGLGTAQARVGFGLSAIPTGSTVLLLSLAVILAARLAATPIHQRPSARVASWLSAFGAAFRLSVGVAMATTAVAVTYLLVQLIQAIGEDTTAIADLASTAGDANSASPLAAVIFGILTLPNVLITGAGFALGSDLAATGDGVVSGSLPSLLGIGDLPFTTYSFGLFTESERPTWLFLLLLTSMIAALTAGVRSIVRTQPAPVHLSTTGQWAVAFAGLWAGLGWLTSVGFGVSGSAAGDMTSTAAQGIGTLHWDGRAGLSYVGIIGLALLWASAAYVSAHWLTPRLGGSAPRSVATIGAMGNHRLHPSWALTLADASVRLEKVLPGWLRSAADQAALNGYTAEQLRLRPGTARKIVLIGGTASLLVIVGIIGTSVLASTTYGPAAAAKGYLDDVASGDARGAMERADLTSGNGELLTDAVLRAQRKESPITQVRVVRTRTSEQDSLVDVTYSVNGAVHSTTLSLTQDETQPQWGGLFHSWTVRDPFAEVAISGVVGPVEVSGAMASGGTTYRVFPGVTTATIPATPLLDAASSASEALAPGSSATLELQQSLRQNVVDEVRTKMVVELTTCAKQTVLAPSGCPFGSSNFVSGRAVGVRWQAAADIANAISVEYSEGSLSTSGELPLTVTYTDVADFNTSAESDTVTADLSASITYAGKGDITIQWAGTSPSS